MQRQVITISPDGSVSGLQVKPGKGFDLRKLGNASITRASEVLFSEQHQLWFVEVREGRFSGQPITDNIMRLAGLTYHDSRIRPDKRIGGVLWFSDYDDAVLCEIAVLDGLRFRSLL